MTTYAPGQRVTCNGNTQGTILRQYSAGSYEVRLMDGSRHVGDVCVSATDLNRENARMIAAAADLLDALKSCVDAMTDAHPNGLPVRQGTLCEEQAWNVAIQSALAAIAKAS